MKKENKDKFRKEWEHFCNCINFALSPLDARAIQFMNEFSKYLDLE